MTARVEGEPRKARVKRGIAPFSLVERDNRGRIVRVTPLRFITRAMFPRPNKNSARLPS